MRIQIRLLFLLMLTVLIAARASAQVSTADLSGTITDQSGGVVPGVEVTLVNEGTQASRMVHTDERGRYQFFQMPPGSYRLTARIEGFQMEVRSGLDLTVGREATMDLRLKVGAIQQEVAVAAEALLVETRDSALSDVMDKTAIRELPLNGRDFAQLALLEPGIAPSYRGSDSGSGTKLVIGGNRPTQVSFLMDGSDINDSTNTTPGGAAGVLLGVDTLAEFRVVTNAFSAEYGRSGGGVISTVTKSGTNVFHGSLFEFVRNSAFDARSYFDKPTDPIPPFRRNQFGVEVDGPVFKNKTFFLGSYEGLRQRLGVTSVSVVPDANARQGIFPTGAPITVNPSIPGYLALIPLPNGLNFGDGTGQYSSAASQATNEDFAAARLDHHFSDLTSAFARYIYDKGISGVPDGFNLVRSDTRSLNRYFTSGVTHTFNSHLLDTFRFSANRSYTTNATSFLQSVPSSLSFMPGVPLGSISVTGFFSLGPSRFNPSYSTYNLYQFSDDLAYSRGRHSMKFGVDHRFYHLDTARPQSPYGFYQFNSLVNFLRAAPQSVELTLPNSTLDRHWRQSMTAAYVQDNISITRKLTVNLGLRYERESVPTEADGRSANLRSLLLDSQATVGPMWVNPTNRGFAPRIGAAWDPKGDGKTVIRSGFGVYYSPLWSDFYANAGGRQPPFYTIGSISNPTFPNAYSLVGNPNFILGRQDVVQYNANYPYVLQYNLTAQRQVSQTGVITIAYIGERGVHLPRFVDGNQAVQTILADGQVFFPPNSPVRNPNFTGIRFKKTDGRSYYNALQVSFQQKFRPGLLLRVNYTFSKNIDTGSIDVSQGGSNDLPQNPDSARAERGLSNYDVRNYFVGYAVWDIPSLPGPRWLGSGWQWNVTTTLASGQPFSAVIGFDRAGAKFQAGTSPQRPDLVPGSSTNPILGDPSRYFDPLAFSLPAAGFYGNLGRNTLIGPGVIMVNTSINRQFSLSERLRLQFRAEMFNVPNHPNFAIPSARTVFTSTGRVASAGLITAVSTPPRQLQLGVKLTF